MRYVHDLFGNPIPAPEAVRKDGRLRRIGYAARPGTGPDKRRCSQCLHFGKIKHQGGITAKCQRMSHLWTHGPETDIHPNAPACREFERRPLPSLVIR